MCNIFYKCIEINIKIINTIKCLLHIDVKQVYDTVTSRYTCIPSLMENNFGRIYLNFLKIKKKANHARYK